jgi:hypothetical protein
MLQDWDSYFNNSGNINHPLTWAGGNLNLNDQGGATFTNADGNVENFNADSNLSQLALSDPAIAKQWSDQYGYTPSNDNATGAPQAVPVTQPPSAATPYIPPVSTPPSEPPSSSSPVAATPSPAPYDQAPAAWNPAPEPASSMMGDYGNYFNNSKPGDSINWGGGTLTRNADGTATYHDPSGHDIQLNQNESQTQLAQVASGDSDLMNAWNKQYGNDWSTALLHPPTNNTVQPPSTTTPYVPPSVVPSTPAPIPAGGSSTVNPLPNVTAMPTQRNQIPFSGDFLHYGQGPEHLFFDKVNPLYGGAGSIWDPSVTGANQQPTQSNENLSYIPPTTGPTGSTVQPTNAFSLDIAHGQNNPGSTAWWNYNNPNNTVAPGGNQVLYNPDGSLKSVGGQAYASGGPAVGGLGALAPRMQGRVHGDAPGQQDNINAALSPGEYIVDADSVAALGDGNTDAGAKALDGMRHAIRTHKRSAPPTKIPPKAKSPMAYLKGGKV